MPNLILSKPQMDIYLSNSDFNLFHAGVGSGKTHLMAFVAYRFATEHTDMLGLIAANTYGQLSNSTLLAIFRVWKDLFKIEEYNDANTSGVFVIGKQPPAHFEKHNYTFTSNANKIFFINGAVIITASLDNYKALDGQTLGWALLDETKDTKQEAVSEVIVARLRQMGLFRSDEKNKPYSNEAAGKGANPLYIFTSPAKTQWLSEFFKLETMRNDILANIFHKSIWFKRTYQINDSTDATVVCSSSYHNEQNLSVGYIDRVKAGLSASMIDLNVYGSPFGKSGAEYYSCFNRDIHATELTVNPDYPLHISFDFNAKPYMTLIVAQVIDNQFNIIDEYTPSAPRNTIEDICSMFVSDYEHLAQNGVFFYGDASGKNSMPIKASRDLYKIVERELAPVYPVRRLLTQNPRHRGIGHSTLGRRDFMNATLKGKYGITVRISNTCIELLNDLEFTREDANGAKLKEKETKNGETYEKRGHTGDAWDYMSCYLFGSYNKEKI